MMRSFEVRDVLAGAYKGRSVSHRILRTHLFEVTNGRWGAGKTLCGRVSEDHLADMPRTESPSCPTCSERYAKLEAKAEGEKGPMVTIVE